MLLLRTTTLCILFLAVIPEEATDGLREDKIDLMR